MQKYFSLAVKTMGCICSKGISPSKCVRNHRNAKDKETKSKKKPTASPKNEDGVLGETDHVGNDAAMTLMISQGQGGENVGSTAALWDDGQKNDVLCPKKVKNQAVRHSSVDVGASQGQHPAKVSRIVSMPSGAQAAHVAAGWPSWLITVAADAVNGWIPRSADTFEKLEKIGQGTYSSVYRARDLESGKIVAMKKVRFVNMDPESVRFMAREINILRRVDHPNVMKLECLVTSRASGNLCLVFDYMEHDLTGLAARPDVKFTEPQIKCFMQQLFCGLEHCHGQGILHRDIKGSNLLIDNNGNLKIADFGLATFFRHDQKQPLTSRVVTLWYRPPELLLGSTNYGVAVDLWSAGCILAELFHGKPIMPGRTEVEQLHKIFKLCGSPSEEYWKKSRLPHATAFKPQHPYSRCLSETFKSFPSSALALLDVLLAIEPEHRGSASLALQSELFTAKPFPCDPSTLPKYPPSKEFDARRRNEEARRNRASTGKVPGQELSRKDGRPSKGVPAPNANAELQMSILANLAHTKSNSEKFNKEEEGGTGFPIESSKGLLQNGLSHSGPLTSGLKNDSEPRAYRTHASRGSSRLSRFASSGSSQVSTNEEDRKFKHMGGNVSIHLRPKSRKKVNGTSGKVYTVGYPPVDRIHCSGPLLPAGGTIDDLLNEHDKQMQQAFRKASSEKIKVKGIKQ